MLNDLPDHLVPPLDGGAGLPRAETASSPTKMMLMITNPNATEIAKGVTAVPMANATYIAKNLIEPVIYPSVADRVALLRRPQATVEFYMRVQEAKAMTQAMAASVANLTPAKSAMINVQPVNAGTVADSLIIALQLARPIVADSDGVSSDMDVWVRDAALHNIENALKSAIASFPDAESFKQPPTVEAMRDLGAYLALCVFSVLGASHSSSHQDLYGGGRE